MNRINKHLSVYYEWKEELVDMFLKKQIDDKKYNKEALKYDTAIVQLKIELYKLKQELYNRSNKGKHVL